MGHRSRHKLTTQASTALQGAGHDFAVHTYTHNPQRVDYGAECVDKVGVEPGRVLKTLVLQVGEAYVVAILPVQTLLNLKAVAEHCGTKRAALAVRQIAERRTGYVLGGVSPFGQRQSHKTLIDVSATQWETVFVSGGRRGVELEVTPQTLITATNGEFARISR